MGKKKEQIEDLKTLFQPVLEWLDKCAPATENGVEFNMSYFRDEYPADNYKGKEVNQTVCIMGALYLFNGMQMGYSFSIFDFFDNPHPKIQLAMDALYRPQILDDKIVLSTIRPYQAAAAIRYFLATGKVKWKRFLH